MIRISASALACSAILASGVADDPVIERARGVGEARLHVFAAEVEEIGEQFVDLRTARQCVEHVDLAHPGASDNRPPATNFGIDDDAFAHAAKMRGGWGSVKGEVLRPVLVPYPLGRGRGSGKELFEGSARTTALPLDGGGISQLESEAN